MPGRQLLNDSELALPDSVVSGIGISLRPLFGVLPGLSKRIIFYNHNFNFLVQSGRS
jgi:hypothetical protein